jgi:hypothetical protein
LYIAMTLLPKIGSSGELLFECMVIMSYEV